MEEKHLASGSDATEKLYYHDSHGKEFTATVLTCEEKISAKGKKEGKPEMVQGSLKGSRDEIEKMFE